MDLGLKGRVAVVSGGSKGIGRDIACSLVSEGVRVVVVARGRRSLDETCRAIERRGGKAVGVAVDLTKRGSAAAVVRAAVRKFGRLDILVNNLGGAIEFGDFFELPERAWRNAFQLNVMTIVSLVRAALPQLRKSSAPRIVNVSSISGVEPGFSNPHYTLTKAAVINLSKYLANRLVNDRILVNTVCPGPVHSDSWEKSSRWLAQNKDMSVADARKFLEEQESRKIPLGRVGDGDDVSGIVCFLASKKAGWITGSCFHVNGGKLRSMC